MRLLLHCLQEIKPVLIKHYKARWVLFLLRAILKSRQLLRASRWGGKKTAEAEYVKSIIILTGMYKLLQRRFIPRVAQLIMEQIVQRLSHTIDYETARRNLLFTIKSPFERWLKYRSILITEGFGLHNEVEDMYISKQRMHYIVKRCIFHDIFTECGVPELTRMICDYDHTYHSAMFPEYYFDRNGPRENAIGYGAECCHYVWKDRETLNRDFRVYLEAPPETRGERPRRQGDRRQQERRRFDRRQPEKEKTLTPG